MPTRPRNWRQGAAIAAALTWLTLAAPAAAQGLIVSARSSILHADQSQSYDAFYNDTYTGTLVPGGAAESAISLEGADPAASSTRATASYGSLGAFAAVAVSNETTLASSRTRQALADGWSAWQDQVTISKADAPIGTPVDIRLTLVVDIAEVSAVTDSWALTIARISLSSQGISWCLNAGSADHPCGAEELALQVGRNVIHVDVQTFTGEQTFGANLYAQSVVEAYTDTQPFQSSARADAINTAHSYYTVLTPDTTLQWASGHDYSPPSPVPEAATFATMIMGLGLIGLRLRRRGRQVPTRRER